MKKTLIIIVLFLLVLELSAQTRLHTSSTFDIIRSTLTRETIDKIWGNKLGPGYISEFGRYGFVIDPEKNSVTYIQYETGRNGRIMSLSMDISDIQSYSICNLLDLAVSTSSPQDQRNTIDADTHYFKYWTDVADCRDEIKGTVQDSLVFVCEQICNACKLQKPDIITYLNPIIKSLSSQYRELINLDFWHESTGNMDSYCIGTIDGYLYFRADINNNDTIQTSDCCEILRTIARYLLANTNKRLSCYIETVDSEQEAKCIIQDSKFGISYEVCTTKEKFTADNVIEMCRNSFQK